MPSAPGGSPDTIFFLSDYGLRDGFVGVVRAVLRRLAHDAVVIDLTHEVPSFDVRAGAEALLRAVPHIGPGVVLAVVDPGVGGDRRAVIAQTSAADAPLWLVGPDNGLLVPALEALGGPSVVYELPSRRSRAAGSGSVTFDGRDVLAPAAAALSRGEDPASLGAVIGFDLLARLPEPVVEHVRLPDGHLMLRVEVTWVDRFGNVQLAARPADLPGELAAAARGTGAVSGGDEDGGPAGSGAGSGASSEAGSAAPHDEDGDDGNDGADDAQEVPEPSVTVVVESEVEGIERLDGPQPARCVRTFSDLDVGELGLLTDSDGRMALVVCEDSASARLGAMTGDLVELVW